MTSPAHDKVIVIVEETVQKVYLLDPDHPETGQVVGGLQQLVTRQGVEDMFFRDNPPPILGKRAKKGSRPAQFMHKHKPVEEYARFTTLTLVIPDENGKHVEERKFTATTVVRKPIKS